MTKEELTQYVVAYKRNGKWFRDSERHQNIKTATKRLNELKNKSKYEEYKIVYREITLWRDYENWF